MIKAVAVQYNKDLPAPFITAKGNGFIADTLIKIAEDHNIPIVKDHLLSETLYIMEPGEYIPEDVFNVVAEILVFIKETQDLI
ncbi:MAG: EscU/YscU/HrcU family type III secretion system export apparatus switch protein [Spirochaetales bacterium]|nr:EscU/YscU/HrcU family type III secretion system export apparatus switch protein [Spirochaetales bacterium]